ncbi:hypothetical protein BLH75_13655 [Listeria monocytogenes]|nr:hypothetical protein [Listeria monocytogenes]
MKLIITLIIILSNWLIQELLMILEVNLKQFLTDNADKVLLDCLKHHILYSKNTGMLILSQNKQFLKKTMYNFNYLSPTLNKYYISYTKRALS